MSRREVDIVLNACSSIGALCDRVRPEIPQPVVRVDAAMARAAVERGRQIGVLATLEMTLAPTTALVEATARDVGRTVAVDAELIEGAYAALMAGDQVRHDDLVQAALARSARDNEVVVLAQASMARVAQRLDASAGERILSSPAFAVEDVAQCLERAGRATS